MSGPPGDRPPGNRPPGGGASGGGPAGNGLAGNGAARRKAARQAPAAGTRPGRRALFSDPSEQSRFDGGTADVAEGRRALFSPGPAAPGPGRGGAVVHCRTCLAATPLSLPALAVALVPSLWLPTRPWPRLMRCPACHRVSWCRIDWPGLL